MPFGIQPIHIIIILIVALLIFGPSRLPELGRSLGKGLNEFRRGAREMTQGFTDEITKPGEGDGTPPAQAMPPAMPPAQAMPPGMPSAEAMPPGQPTIAPTATGNFCTQCGSPNAAGARFCSKCGAQLAA